MKSNKRQKELEERLAYLIDKPFLTKEEHDETPIRRRRKTSGASIWMWMILCINIITDNENKKDRMIISYPSTILIKYLTPERDERLS